METNEEKKSYNSTLTPVQHKICMRVFIVHNEPILQGGFALHANERALTFFADARYWKLFRIHVSTLVIET